MRSDTSPLLTHHSPDAVVARRRGEAISARRFLHDAAQLADRLPPGRHVLNVCSDRYAFTLGFAACLMTERVSLLPSTHTPDVVRRLAQSAPDVFCLTDEPGCTIDLPQVRFPELRPAPQRADPDETWRVPEIANRQVAAIVYTSGTTGTPMPYEKTWGKLARCVHDGASVLGLSDGRTHTLIGTVPAQHMYGFESTVLLPLQTGNALCAERPFYPADISAALAAMPEPRALISTPVHLRALLSAGTLLPPVELIVSATAPLPQDLAREVESKYQTRVLEIYGSTETGQIAARRPAASPTFSLWPDVRLAARDGAVYAHGGHVEQITPLCDVLELTGEHEFLLHGRTEDLVNIAGKRSSFAYLDAQLTAVPGVVDGAFFLPDEAQSGATGVVRLCAAVVAPGLQSDQLAAELRLRIDPVFLPRPLLLVDRLPRNATGKLPRDALQALGRSPFPVSHAASFPVSHAASGAGSASTARSELRIARDHPAFAGHFPGFPILPGAALLDLILHEIERIRSIDLTQWTVASAKFLSIVRPGDDLTLEHSPAVDGAIRFVIRGADRAVASGMLTNSVPRERGRGA
jgi:acyl-coenzyme A synthetase/AMP-(fatty) acid ligase/3-hydroxymyristoyl/3-hydroxydecanoyl-(acyl carrier protein) dehydratase